MKIWIKNYTFLSNTVCFRSCYFYIFQQFLIVTEIFILFLVNDYIHCLIQLLAKLKSLKIVWGSDVQLYDSLLHLLDLEGDLNKDLPVYLHSGLLERIKSCMILSIGWAYVSTMTVFSIFYCIFRKYLLHKSTISFTWICYQLLYIWLLALYVVSILQVIA